MAAQYADIEAHDAIVLAVSADDLSGAQEAAQSWGPPFPILYNPDKTVIDTYGVRAGNIATPATFVIDKSGTIRWRYIGGNKTDRPSPTTVIAQLQALPR